MSARAGRIEQATFGAGCFWGAEARFRALPGVVDSRVGYATGTDGSTAPARIEVVQVDFDPAEAAYADLLEAFWTSHDPRSFDRQGDEAGEGVRSAIFVHSDAQAQAARAAKAALNDGAARPVVTQIIAFAGLELADEHHQRYVEKNGATACSI